MMKPGGWNIPEHPETKLNNLEGRGSSQASKKSGICNILEHAGTFRKIEY